MKKSDIAKLTVAAVFFCIAGWIAWPEESVEPESESTKSTLASSPIKTQSSSELSPEQCAPLPSRMLSVPAPNAHELILATRLLREAADPEFAAITLQVQKARELAHIQKETWELKAARAESEARYAEAKQREKDVNSGVNVSDSGSLTESEITRLGRNDALNGGRENGEGTSIRLGTDDPNSLMINVNGRWYRNVKVGQYVGEFEVKRYDDSLRCAFLVGNYGKGEEYPACYN